MTTQDIARQLGANIAEKRKKLGLTQAQLAEKVDIGQDALSRMEKGKISPKINRLPVFAEVLGCSVPELFHSKNEECVKVITQIAEIIKPLSPEKQTDFIEILQKLILFIHK